jgi:hypothetical protein
MRNVMLVNILVKILLAIHHLFSPFFPFDQVTCSSSASQQIPLWAPQSSAHEQVKFYLHTDKSTYQPGEALMFTSYILNRDEALMEDQHTLYILLVDAVNRKLVYQQRFRIRHGLTKSTIFLPDTVTAGQYWILSYTNAYLDYDNQPIFRKFVTIRTQTASPFKIEQQMAAPLQDGSDSIQVSYRISTSYSGLAAGGEFDYTIWADSDSITFGKKVIDGFGQVSIRLAQHALVGRKVEIVANVKRDGLTRGFILPVTLRADSSRVKNADQVTGNRQNTVLIEADSLQYRTRSKVILHIHIRDSLGRPLAGAFSLAVTATRKIDSPNSDDIEHFSMTSTPSVIPAAIAWSKVQPGKSLQIANKNVADFGYVLEDGRRPKKPVSLTLLGNKFLSFQTDSSGWFALPYSLLTAPPGSTNYLSVAENGLDRYKIMVYSKADIINTQLAAIHFPINSTAEWNDEEEKTQGTGPMLKAAVVTATIPDECEELLGVYNSRHCDQDYVCRKGISPGGLGLSWLNSCDKDRCRSCSIEKPEEGMSYLFSIKAYRSGRLGGAIIVTYHCAAPTVPAFMKALDPILTPPVTSPQDSAMTILGSGLRSTICWKPLLSTDASGVITVSFLTDDLNGKFTCTLQGISTEGVISGKSSFMVPP